MKVPATKKETKKEEIIKEKDPKKTTTKEMIHQALVDLKSRRGTSLYAIKKYIEEKYSVDVERLSYLIKKNLKDSVEAGDIVRTTGTGASGSFKLPAGSKIVKKKESKKSIEKVGKAKEKSDKPKVKKAKEKVEKMKKVDVKVSKNVEGVRSGKKVEVVEMEGKKEKVRGEKKVLKKSAKILETPKKSRVAMKRKSIGSIIKAPKMKPQAKA